MQKILSSSEIIDLIARNLPSDIDKTSFIQCNKHLFNHKHLLRFDRIYVLNNNNSDKIENVTNVLIAPDFKGSISNDSISLPKLTNLNTGRYYNEPTNFSKFHHLTHLELGKFFDQKINLYRNSLTHLTLHARRQCRQIDFSQLPDLTYLELHFAKTVSIDNPSRLTHLNLCYTKLTIFNNLSYLTHLFIASCEVQSIDLTPVINLSHLTIKNGSINIMHIDLPHITSLTNITHLTLLCFTNNPINFNDFPKLTHLILGSEYTYQLDKLNLPLLTNFSYNQNKIVNMSNLPSLKRLTYGSEFNKRIKTPLPRTITRIVFGPNFNHPIENILPQKLENLTLGIRFSYQIIGVIPPSVSNLNIITVGFKSKALENLIKQLWTSTKMKINFIQ